MFSAVFMTGSGSTLVCVGSDAAPQFLSDPKHQVRRMWDSGGREFSICASEQRGASFFTPTVHYMGNWSHSLFLYAILAAAVSGS